MALTTNQKIRVGIVGSAGYTGGELIRILIHHPDVEIVFAHSESQAGKPIHAVHNDLFGDTELLFASELEQNIDVLFLCVGHGNARKFLEHNQVAITTRIIDLSQDFRLQKNSEFDKRSFIYGLPELNRDLIKEALNIANPGCFATTIELALLPLAKRNLLHSAIYVNATTGSTGAGQAPSPTTHFSWRNNNLSAYNAYEHRHIAEICETLSHGGNHSPLIHFIPQRGAFPRGIFATVSMESKLSANEAIELYKSYYENHPFTHISDAPVDLKQVVNTNKCLIYIEKHNTQLFIISATDNLVKGASGQAVQNMNLLFGLEESAGLKLKPSAF